jgi:hypothetical protein
MRADLKVWLKAAKTAIVMVARRAGMLGRNLAELMVVETVVR